GAADLHSAAGADRADLEVQIEGVSGRRRSVSRARQEAARHGGLHAFGEPTQVAGAVADAADGYDCPPGYGWARQAAVIRDLATARTSIMRMKHMKVLSMLALLTAGGALGAQQPTPPPVVATPVRDTTVVPLDRLVAIVGD